MLSDLLTFYQRPAASQTAKHHDDKMSWRQPARRTHPGAHGRASDTITTAEKKEKVLQDDLPWTSSGGVTGKASYSWADKRMSRSSKVGGKKTPDTHGAVISILQVCVGGSLTMHGAELSYTLTTGSGRRFCKVKLRGSSAKLNVMGTNP